MKIWSDVEYVYRCLADTERTLAFRTAIEAAVRPGDTVLDPFSGSGTTGMVSTELGRKSILIELNPEYVSLAQNRTNVTAGLAL